MSPTSRKPPKPLPEVNRLPEGALFAITHLNTVVMGLMKGAAGATVEDYGNARERLINVCLQRHDSLEAEGGVSANGRTITVQKVNSQQWRIVEDGAYIIARCAFEADALRIRDALAGQNTTQPSQPSPVFNERLCSCVGTHFNSKFPDTCAVCLRRRK